MSTVTKKAAPGKARGLLTAAFEAQGVAMGRPAPGPELVPDLDYGLIPLPEDVAPPAPARPKPAPPKPKKAPVAARGGDGAATPAPSSIKAPTLIQADDLARKDIPPLRWIIPGLLPEGACILAGRPKRGKSWLSLHLALAVAWGGKALGGLSVGQGRVLYLALEDGERRLQDRLARLDSGAPHELTFATRWARAADGGVAHINEWLPKHKEDARLVVIDTLARFRDRRTSSGNVYDADYQAIEGLQQLATEYRVAVLVVHHTSKRLANDPFDTVNASLGLTGAADAMLILERANNTPFATLHPSGRDLPNEEPINLRWVGEQCLWQVTDQAPPEAPQGAAARESKIDQAVKLLEGLLKSGPRPVKECYEAADKKGITEGTLRAAAKRASVELERSKEQRGGHSWFLPGYPGSEQSSSLALEEDPGFSSEPDDC
jgi:hypothetical protein